MTRRDLGSEENPSVWGQNFAAATEAVVIGSSRVVQPYGYALVSGTKDDPEIRGELFPDEATLRLALGTPLMRGPHHTFYRIGPGDPVRLHTVEQSDEPDHDAEVDQ